MTVSDMDMDSVDPWSPGYVTPTSTPSPRSARAQSPGRGLPGSAKRSVTETSLNSLNLDGEVTPFDGPAVSARLQGPVAVSVRGAHHSYFNYSLNSLAGKTSAVQVLNDFNMTVHQGSIYALLGSSGCGKTTVLRAMVGQHRLTVGRVRVFGKEPRSTGIGIPGPSLGYMPQELAVPDGFTIRESLMYFGWLAGMSNASIEEHSGVLLRLLDLPGADRLVSDLSGGQQRRVSLAVALLHSPPLLILDEPTVGVDPIVRQSIWEHLLDLTSGGRTTVIITTHYIEEARQAHVVGLMRRGALLAEETPDTLLSTLNCSTLEEVLLKLCLKQDSDEVDLLKVLRADGMCMAHELDAIKEAATEVKIGADAEEDEVEHGSRMRVHLRRSKTSSKVKALLWKNFMWIWRHKAVSAALVFLPAFIALVYNGGVGAPPRGLPVAVVNHETNCSDWQGLQHVDCGSPRSLSCLFIENMRAATLQPVMFGEQAVAEQAVLDGRAWGVVHFAANYSDSLVERAGITVSVDFPYQDYGALEHSEVSVRLDMSLQTIGYLVMQALQNVETQSLEAFNDQCHSNAHMIRTPVQFHSELRPTSSDPSFLDYSLPGLILSVTFMFGFTTSMSSLLPEKTDKILERSLVYGVHMSEVLLAQFIAQLLIVTSQITLVLLVAFGLFANPLVGPIVPYILLCLAQGVCGMWYGLLTAVLCDTTTAASLIGVGSYFSLMFMSSMLWPLEGMHVLLRPIATILPMTTATISLRNIALRAWNMYHPGVYLGFLSTFSWTVAFIILTFFSIKMRF